MAGLITRQCERCHAPVHDHELTVTRRLLGYQRRVHAGCLTPTEKREMFLAQSGLPCLFCRERGFTMRQLIDHFGQEHGRVLVNW